MNSVRKLSVVVLGGWTQNSEGGRNRMISNRAKARDRARITRNRDLLTVEAANIELEI